MKYEAVIGLEVHAELSTKSKIYCSCSTGFGAPINTHTCPVCTGMPGALPVLNKQVVHYAAKMGKATGCTVNQLCKADRKNYFTPTCQGHIRSLSLMCRFARTARYSSMWTA